MERRRRGRETDWSVEGMDPWLVTPEDLPDSCRSEDSLIEFAPEGSAEGSDNLDEPNDHRRDFRRDTILPTSMEKVAMMVAEKLQRPRLSESSTTALHPLGPLVGCAPVLMQAAVRVRPDEHA